MPLNKTFGHAYERSRELSTLILKVFWYLTGSIIGPYNTPHHRLNNKNYYGCRQMFNFYILFFLLTVVIYFDFDFFLIDEQTRQGCTYKTRFEFFLFCVIFVG